MYDLIIFTYIVITKITIWILHNNEIRFRQNGPHYSKLKLLKWIIRNKRSICLYIA